MTPISQKTEKIITLLLEQHLITISQTVRVRALLNRGIDIHEAIAKTPIVDPLKLASVESQAAEQLILSSREVRKPAFTTPLPVSAAAIAAVTPVALPVTPNPAGDLDDDLDDHHSDEMRISSLETFRFPEQAAPVETVPASVHGMDPELEFEPQHLSHEFALDPDLIHPDEYVEEPPAAAALSEDLDFPEPTPKTPQPMRARTRSAPTPAPQELEFEVPASMKQDETPSKAAIPKLTTNFEAEVSDVIERAMSGENPLPAQRAGEEFDSLPPLEEKTSFQTPGKSMQGYSTADDEGINLIREVNEIFARMIEKGSAGFVLDPRHKESNLLTYNAEGAFAGAESISPDRIEKVSNRLKVMGRLEPWRRQSAQKGHFRMIHSGENYHAYIHTEPKPANKEVLVVHLERQYGN